MNNPTFPTLDRWLSWGSLVAALFSATCLLLSWAIGKIKPGTYDPVITLFVCAFVIALLATVTGGIALVRLRGQKGRVPAWLGVGMGFLVLVPTGVLVFFALVIVAGGPAH